MPPKTLDMLSVNIDHVYLDLKLIYYIFLFLGFNEILEFTLDIYADLIHEIKNRKFYLYK